MNKLKKEVWSVNIQSVFFCRQTKGMSFPVEFKGCLGVMKMWISPVLFPLRLHSFLLYPHSQIRVRQMNINYQKTHSSIRTFTHLPKIRHLLTVIPLILWGCPLLRCLQITMNIFPLFQRLLWSTVQSLNSVTQYSNKSRVNSCQISGDVLAFIRKCLPSLQMLSH